MVQLSKDSNFRRKIHPKKLYKDFIANLDLLKKCQHGRTQNANELLNSVIWTRISKNIFIGLETLKLRVFDAIITCKSFTEHMW